MRNAAEAFNKPPINCIRQSGGDNVKEVSSVFRAYLEFLNAVAGPSLDPEGYDCDQDMKVVSIPAITNLKG